MCGVFLPYLRDGALIAPVFLSLNGKPMPLATICRFFAASSLPVGGIGGRIEAAQGFQPPLFGSTRFFSGDAAGGGERLVTLVRSFSF